jgi:hypothetical protein
MGDIRRCHPFRVPVNTQEYVSYKYTSPSGFSKTKAQQLYNNLPHLLKIHLNNRWLILERLNFVKRNSTTSWLMLF